MRLYGIGSGRTTSGMNRIRRILAPEIEVSVDGPQDASLYDGVIAHNSFHDPFGGKLPRILYLASAKTADCCGSCGGAKAAALASGKSDCSQPCGGVNTAALASAKGDCCGSCGGAAPASYVTYDCTKCNALARTAAEAYLSLMMEIKKVAGAEGCPMEAADLTLAAVMADMQNAAQANAGVNATTVSLSSVSEKKSDCCPTPCEVVTKK